MGVVEAFGNVADILANMNPEKVANLRASQEMATRVEELVNKKKEFKIAEEESIELERYLSLDLLLNLAKARAQVLIATQD
ncbi:MAG: hypothetical protein AB8F95_17205 [Bacteroidia bacterium]